MRFLLATLVASAAVTMAQTPSATLLPPRPVQARPPQPHAPQSHPSWWNWASADATALVGIRWEALKSSPFSSALEEEWSAPVGLNMPDLPCLKQARQFLLSAPAFLAVVNGDFTAAQLRAEAAEQAMKPSSYRGVELWISPGKSTMSVARVSDQVLLVGLRRTLESAIDRNQADGERHYSPLLQRAARFSGQDLWVIAAQLPDPLASGFVPLDIEARGFEGSVNLTDGIRVEATLATGSQDEASALEGRLRHLAPSLPPVARGLQVVQAGDQVVLAMVVSQDQLAANLRPVPAPLTSALPVASAPPASAPPVAASTPPLPAVVPDALRAAPAPVAIAASVTPQPEAKPAAIPAKPSGPRVIRIMGLDEGPREIILPRAD